MGSHFISSAAVGGSDGLEARPTTTDEDFARWEKSIAAFEKQDRESAPPKHGVLFVGSSSVRLWDLDKSFPDLKPLNRGFGGSRIADSIHFADRVVLKHEPRVVVMYAGDNDVAGGKTIKRKSAETVHQDFRRFAKTVHESLPETKVVYIAIKPSLKRWELRDEMQQANDAIAADCAKDELLEFVDVWTPMLGDDGKPREELFVKDGLHLSGKGYELWTELVRPHVAKSAK